MNLKIIEKILTSNCPYWVIFNIVTGYNTTICSIIMCGIPSDVEQGLKREDIKLSHIEQLLLAKLQNVSLNENYSPFQYGQTFKDTVEAYPIPCKQKEFLIKALALESDDILDYKKLIDELCK